MTCKECKHFQPTSIMEVDIKPYFGKGYTLQEILKISEKDDPKPMWDCPYANDWCEEDDEINTLCDNKFEPKQVF